MKKTGAGERRRFVYEPPIAVELSGHRVNGQQVKSPGVCISGSQPTGQGCTAGGSFDHGNCKPGSMPNLNLCNQGGYPSNYCGTGSAPT